jgi:hypothetical protein
MMDRLLALSALVLVAGASAACAGPTQVSFVSNEEPNNASGAQRAPVPRVAHREVNATPELPSDDVITEPEHPAVGTKQERALVHIHGPNGVCSGVVLGPRLIATAQRCLKGEPKGLKEIAQDREYRIEVASSTLTWTNRRAKFAILPDCRWHELDLGILVLSEPVPWVQPLKVMSAPGTGGKVQALGFGHCEGQKESIKERIGTVRNRDSEAIVIDVPLCKGDTGGAVVDGAEGDVIGIISHRDDPEGSPLRTTTIARLDTGEARDLLAQAKQLADGTDATKLPGVVCQAPGRASQ